MDKKILQLDVKNTLPTDGTFIPMSDKNGKMFYFEYASQTEKILEEFDTLSEADAKMLAQKLFNNNGTTNN